MKQIFLAFLAIVLVSTQSFALNQEIQREAQVFTEIDQLLTDTDSENDSESSEQAIEMGSGLEVTSESAAPSRRLTLADRIALWKLNRPGVARRAHHQLRTAWHDLSTDQKKRFLEGAKASSEADLFVRMDREIDQELTKLKSEIKRIGIRAVKKNIRSQAKAHASKIEQSRSPAAVLLIGALALVAVAAILVAAQIVLWILLPLILVGAVVILFVKGGEANRCTRGGCPSTRRMVGY